MPAPMHRNAVDAIGSKKLMPVATCFSPGRIIRERRYHLDFMATASQEFTERDIVRRDPSDLRRVVNAPNNGPHYPRLECRRSS